MGTNTPGSKDAHLDVPMWILPDRSHQEIQVEGETVDVVRELLIVDELSQGCLFVPDARKYAVKGFT